MWDTMEHCVRAYKKQHERLKTGNFWRCEEKNIVQSEYAPLYEKDTKKTQNKPMETTKNLDFTAYLLLTET